jgi:tetratricopeptide (TPR) repeat protein
VDRRRRTDLPPYAFAHWLTRDSAYGALLERNRRALHGAAVDALAAQLVPGAPDELARLMELVDQSAAAGRWAEAHNFCCQALGARTQVGQVGGWEQGAERAAQLWQLAREGSPALPPMTADLANCWALHCASTGRMVEATQYAQQALALAEAALQAGDPHARLNRATALNNCGLAVHYSGHPAQAQPAYTQALAAFKELGDNCGMARACNNLGSSLLEIGQPAAARPILTEGLELAAASGHRLFAANLAVNLGLVLKELDELELARQYLEQSLSAARETGAFSVEGMAQGNLGMVAMAEGKFQEARDLFRSALHLARQVNAPRFAAWWMSHLAQLALLEEDCAESRRLAAAAAEEALRSGSLNLQIHVTLMQGQIALAQGETSQAHEFLAQAEALALQTGGQHLWRVSDDLERLRSMLIQQEDERPLT